MTDTASLAQMLREVLVARLARDPILLKADPYQQDVRLELLALAHLCQQEGLPVKYQTIRLSTHPFPHTSVDSTLPGFQVVSRMWLHAPGALVSLVSSKEPSRMATPVIVQSVDQARQAVLDDAARVGNPGLCHAQILPMSSSLRVNGSDEKKMRPYLADALARYRERDMEGKLPHPANSGLPKQRL